MCERSGAFAHLEMCERSGAFVYLEMCERSEAFAHLVLLACGERIEAFECANAPERSHISK